MHNLIYFLHNLIMFHFVQIIGHSVHCRNKEKMIISGYIKAKELDSNRVYSIKCMSTVGRGL